MLKPLTQERVKELLDYEPVTGVLTNKINRGRNAMAGTVAGCVCSLKTGYLVRQIVIDRHKCIASRVIWLWMTGRFPDGEIDHKDQDSLNNKWINLRDVTVQENHRNELLSKNNTTGITGVYWDKRLSKWIARIMINRKTIHLGVFDTKIAAAYSRHAANIKYGFSLNHGRKRLV